MDEQQEEKYGELVDKWLEAVQLYGQGWDEDAPEIPVDYPLDVDMVDYHVGGLFSLEDGRSEVHLFTNPLCEIRARVKKVKVHMNRCISAMEFANQNLRGRLGGGLRDAIDAWDFVREATAILRDAHHGDYFRTMLRSKVFTRLEAHATKIPSTLTWDIGCGYSIEQDAFEPSERTVEELQWHFYLKTTVFTTCPFVLFETHGKHSHTQRTHIEIELDATERVAFWAIMREITTRLVPVMSCMKIPDEVIQVCKSYAGPTFTEDGAVRVQKILRGIIADIVPNGNILLCKVKVTSEDSHLQHDIVTSLTTTLNE